MSFRNILCLTVAEADVRVRVRGRIVSVHRQRGQVRVVSVIAATEATNRRDSAAALLFLCVAMSRQLFKELNLTSRRVLRFPCALWSLAWISDSLMSHHISTINPRIVCRGLLRISAAGAANDAQFSFSALRLRSGGFSSSLRSSVFVDFNADEHRCRSRCSSTRTRANSKRTTTTGTGPWCKRQGRDGSHEPTSCLLVMLHL